MHLHQRGQPGTDGQAVQMAKLFVIKTGNNEQDGVRPVLDGLGQLPLVDHEILAKQRQGDGPPNGAEIVE